MSKLGYILLLLSAPFFLETGFEMYVLTAFTGPQMLGFALMHSRGMVGLVALGVSALSFLVLGIFSLVVLCRLLGTKIADRRQKLFAWVFGVQVLHTVLFFLYDYWSPVFSRAAS